MSNSRCWLLDSSCKWTKETTRKNNLLVHKDLWSIPFGAIDLEIYRVWSNPLICISFGRYSQHFQSTEVQHTHCDTFFSFHFSRRHMMTLTIQSKLRCWWYLLKPPSLLSRLQCESRDISDPHTATQHWHWILAHSEQSESHAIDSMTCAVESVCLCVV